MLGVRGHGPTFFSLRPAHFKNQVHCRGRPRPALAFKRSRLDGTVQ